MRRIRLTTCVGVCALATVVACVDLARAQTASTPPPASATSDPHPAMPWSLWSRYMWDTGDALRLIEVPPQPVTIETLVPMPGSLPSQLQAQVVEIPGYVITETTTGFYVPERWTLLQPNVGVYQWQMLPAEFRRK